MWGRGRLFRRTVRRTVEGQAIGVVTEPIQGRGGEQAVGWEGLIPLREVEVGGNDGRYLLIALGDQPEPALQVFAGGTQDLCQKYHIFRG